MLPLPVAPDTRVTARGAGPGPCGVGVGLCPHWLLEQDLLKSHNNGEDFHYERPPKCLHQWSPHAGNLYPVSPS